MEYLTEELIKRIIEKIDRNVSYTVRWKSHFRNKIIFLLLLYTGAKLNEILDLNMENIDLENGRIYIGKDKKRRIIPIHPNLKIELEKYLKIYDKNDKLFDISRQVFNIYLSDLSKEFSIRLTPRVITNTFIKRAIEANIPADIITKWVGRRVEFKNISDKPDIEFMKRIP